MARTKVTSDGTRQEGVMTKEHGFITEKGWKFLVHRNPHWALKAVVKLFDRQTEDEQRHHVTCHLNARGFRADDASRGAKLAKRIMWLVGQPSIGSFKAAAVEMRAEQRDDLELALFLAKRYRRQCLNIVARAQEGRR